MKTRRGNHEGSIVKRERNGVIRYEWRQMVDGDLRTVSAQSMDELQNKMLRVKDMPVDKGKTKVNEWLQKWLLSYVNHMMKPATIEQYTIMVNKHITPFIGRMKLTSLKKSDVQMVIAKANVAKLSTTTMKHIRKVMHIAFAQAVSDGLIYKNPVMDIQVPLKQAKARKVLTPQEITSILGQLKNSRWKSSVMFLIATGLRRSEMLSLTWNDINVEDRTIRVKDSLSRLGKPGDTKSSKEHLISLSITAMKALEDQKEMLKKEGNSAFFGEDKTHYIFPNRLGEALHPQSYYKIISRAGKTVNIKASPHMFRHTFVYLTRGVLSLKDLQNTLGHGTSTTTLEIYGDIINENFVQVANQIDSVMDSLTETLNKSSEKSNVVSFNKKAK